VAIGTESPVLLSTKRVDAQPIPEGSSTSSWGRDKAGIIEDEVVTSGVVQATVGAALVLSVVATVDATKEQSVAIGTESPVPLGGRGFFNVM
jgi:hypothetical protein